MTRKENQPKKDLDEALLLAYAITFIPRTDFYPLQLDTGGYVVIKKSLHPGVIAAHFKGLMTIGAYALDPNGWAKWLVYDADTQERWQHLINLSRHLSSEAIVPYLEPSRRGGHLWLFTDSIPSFQIRRFGKQLLADHKLDAIEIYPKQDKPVTGPGSLVRLPLGIHRLTGKRYHFITQDGTPLAPTIRDQIKILTNPARVPLSFVDKILARSPLAVHHSPTPTFDPKTSSGETVSERLKNRISVFDFVSQYVELDQRGRGHCPFHDDQHRSFGVNQAHNFWHCFACERGGSIIDFWSLFRKKQGEDSSFKETITDLAQKLLK